MLPIYKYNLFTIYLDHSVKINPSIMKTPNGSWILIVIECTATTPWMIFQLKRTRQQNKIYNSFFASIRNKVKI